MLYLLNCNVGSEEPDVVCHRPSDQVRILRYEGDGPAQSDFLNSSIGRSARSDGAGRGGSQGQEQLNEGRLSASGRPNHADDFALTKGCGDAFENVVLAIVGECRFAKAQSP